MMVMMVQVHMFSPRIASTTTTTTTTLLPLLLTILSRVLVVSTVLLCPLQDSILVSHSEANSSEDTKTQGGLVGVVGPGW